MEKKKYLFWIPRRVNFVTFEFSNFLSIATFEGRYFWLIGNIYTIGLCRSVFLQPCQIEVMRVNLNYILQQNYTNLRPGYWDDLTIHPNRIIDESSLEHDHNAMGHEGSLLGTGTCFQGPEVPLKGSKISLLGSERQGFEGSLVRTWSVFAGTWAGTSARSLTKWWGSCIFLIKIRSPSLGACSFPIFLLRRFHRPI